MSKNLTDVIFRIIECIEKKADDTEFGKIFFKRRLFQDRIKGSDICQLLYNQQILSVADDDSEKLVSGQIDAFLFMKKKIEQLEIIPAQLVLQQESLEHFDYCSKKVFSKHAVVLRSLQEYSKLFYLDKKYGLKILKVLTQKYCSRNKKNNPRRRLERKGIRRKRR